MGKDHRQTGMKLMPARGKIWKPNRLIHSFLLSSTLEKYLSTLVKFFYVIAFDMFIEKSKMV